MIQWPMKSSMGTLYLVGHSAGLRGVYWKRQSIPIVKSLRGMDGAVKFLARAVAEITEYLSGKRKEFSLPIDTPGTEFQMQVWAELRKIPYGQTISYLELAARVGRPRAMRAVGTANGKNPVSLLVPCHRVVAADGSLGGYAGGLEIKQRLLTLEGAALKSVRAKTATRRR